MHDDADGKYYFRIGMYLATTSGAAQVQFFIGPFSSVAHAWHYHFAERRTPRGLIMLALEPSTMVARRSHQAAHFTALTTPEEAIPPNDPPVTHEWLEERYRAVTATAT